MTAVPPPYDPSQGGPGGPDAAADTADAGRHAVLPGALLVLAVLVGVALALPALARSPDLEPAASPAGAAGPTGAGVTDTAATLAPSDPAALARLRRAATAASTSSWQGNEVIAVIGSAPSTVIADVQHRALVGSELRVVGGTQRPGMTAFSPDSATFAGSSPLTSPMPAVSNGEWTGLLAQSFAVTEDGVEQVAGQTCDRLELRRADGATAARMWISRSTGLELQRQVFDSSGALLRYNTFTRMQVVPDQAVADVGRDMSAAPDDVTREAPAGSAVPAAALAGLSTTGYTVPSTLAGSLELVGARSFGAPLRKARSTGTLQLTYSDGLSTMTVSEERGRLAAALPAGWVAETRSGARVQVRRQTPERLAWAAGGMVFTVVADTGDDTIDAALTALPRPAVTGGYAPRMRSGVDRVLSWLNPVR